MPRSVKRYEVDENTGCWIWKGKIDRNGYASAWRDGKDIQGSRMFYEDANGAIPSGLQIDHLCRNRACVNPDHLEAVTAKENIRRKPSLKLDMDKADEIRRLSATMSQVEISRIFGVTPMCISLVVSGKRWS